MPLNVELIRKVQAHIQEVPERFDMEAWCEHSDKAPCGTVACIAGWSYILAGETGRAQSIRRGRLIRKSWLDDREKSRIAQLLGLPDGMHYDEVFYEEGWPYELYQDFTHAISDAERAEVACRRLDLLVEEGR